MFGNEPIDKKRKRNELKPHIIKVHEGEVLIIGAPSLRSWEGKEIRANGIWNVLQQRIKLTRDTSKKNNGTKKKIYPRFDARVAEERSTPVEETSKGQPLKGDQLSREEGLLL